MLGDIYPRRQGSTDDDQDDNTPLSSLTNSLDLDNWQVDEEQGAPEQNIWQMPAPSSYTGPVDQLPPSQQPSLPVEDDQYFPEYQDYHDDNDQVYQSYQAGQDQADEQVSEYSLTQAQELTPEQQDPREQMQFGLETAKVTKVQILRRNIRRWEYIIQVLPFWKSEMITFNITFSFLTIVGLALLVVFTFSKLPTQVPLIYQQLDGSWLLINKSVLAIILVGLAMLELILIRLKRVIFNFDRRLSNVMATTQIFVNALAIIAFVQIISLVLV